MYRAYLICKAHSYHYMLLIYRHEDIFEATWNFRRLETFKSQLGTRYRPNWWATISLTCSLINRWENMSLTAIISAKNLLLWLPLSEITEPLFQWFFCLLTLWFHSCHARAEKLGTTGTLNWGELSELPDCCELDTMPSFLLCFVPLPAVQTGISLNLAEGDNVLVLNTVREPVWINIFGCKTPERLVSPPTRVPPHLHKHSNVLIMFHVDSCDNMQMLAEPLVADSQS